MKKISVVICSLFLVSVNLFATDVVTKTNDTKGFYISQGLNTCGLIFDEKDDSAFKLSDNNDEIANMKSTLGFIYDMKLAESFNDIFSVGLKIEASFHKVIFITIIPFIKLNLWCPLYLEIGTGLYCGSSYSDDFSLTIFESLGYQWKSKFISSLQYFIELDATVLPFHLSESITDFPMICSYYGLNIGIKCSL